MFWESRSVFCMESPNGQLKSLSNSLCFGRVVPCSVWNLQMANSNRFRAHYVLGESFRVLYGISKWPTQIAFELIMFWESRSVFCMESPNGQLKSLSNSLCFGR